MKSPRSVIRDVHPFLALARRGHERAVHIEHRLLEEGFGLLHPHAAPRRMDGCKERLDVRRAKPPAEVPRRRRIRDALCPQRIQIDLVVAQQLQIFQALATCKQVVRDVQHVIRLVVRKMDLQQMQPSIDLFDQSDLARQRMHRAQSPARHPPRAVGDLIVNPPRTEHRPPLGRPGSLPQSPLDPSLAFPKLQRSTGLHSKSPSLAESVWLAPAVIPHKDGLFVFLPLRIRSDHA